MNWITSIFQMANKNWTSRIFTLILIGLLTYCATTIFAAKAKAKCEDCTPFKEQNKQLISALIEIKKDLQANITTSYNGNYRGVIFASYDTLPRNKYQQAQQRVINKIDSILYRIKQDSVKQKSKT